MLPFNFNYMTFLSSKTKMQMKVNMQKQENLCRCAMCANICYNVYNIDLLHYCQLVYLNINYIYIIFRHTNRYGNISKKIKKCKWLGFRSFQKVKDIKYRMKCVVIPPYTQFGWGILKSLLVSRSGMGLLAYNAACLWSELLPHALCAWNETWHIKWRCARHILVMH